MKILFAVPLLIYESIVEIAPDNGSTVAEFFNSAVDDLISPTVRITVGFAARKNRR